MLEFFVLEDELDWLSNHESAIDAALTVAEFKRRTKVRDVKYAHHITHAANYDQGVHKTAHKKFDAYVIDGRFPMHKDEENKHLLGVEFVKYLMGEGIPAERIFFVSSQYSMLEGAVGAGLLHVFKKYKVENEEKLNPIVKLYRELPEALKSTLQIK